jgi:hypothetical protein
MDIFLLCPEAVILSKGKADGLFQRKLRSERTDNEIGNKALCKFAKIHAQCGES